MNEQTKKDAAQQAKPVYRELVTINGKNVVLAHNEPPVVNAGVLEMAEIFRMFNIFDEKFSPSNIDKADGTPLRLYTSDRVKVDVSQAPQARHGLLAPQHRRPRDHLLRQGRAEVGDRDGRQDHASRATCCSSRRASATARCCARIPPTTTC